MRAVLSASFGVIAVLFAGSALAANCNVTGQWTIRHDNGAIAEMFVSQSANGTIRASNVRQEDTTGRMTGGKVVGKKVGFLIRWRNGHEGQYAGTVAVDGLISGTNFDTTASPAPIQNWHTTVPVQCERSLGVGNHFRE